MTSKQRNKIYEDFIKNNPSFIKSKVKSFAFKFNKMHLYDLLESEAQIIVLNAINKFDSNINNNLKNWLSVALYNGLNRYLQSLTVDYEVDIDEDKVGHKVLVDFDSCIDFLLYFEKINILHQYIIISYFYDNMQITTIAELFNLDRRRVKEVINNYSLYIHQAINNKESSFEELKAVNDA